MTEDKNELIKLLSSAEFGVNKMRLTDKVSEQTLETIADYLIANNVTIQRG